VSFARWATATAPVSADTPSPRTPGCIGGVAHRGAGHPVHAGMTGMHGSNGSPTGQVALMYRNGAVVSPKGCAAPFPGLVPFGEGA